MNHQSLHCSDPFCFFEYKVRFIELDIKAYETQRQVPLCRAISYYFNSYVPINANDKRFNLILTGPLSAGASAADKSV